MRNEIETRRAVGYILLAVVVVLVIILVVINLNKKETGANNNQTNQTQDQDKSNYVENNGKKTNTSEGVTGEKQMEDVKVEKASLQSEGGVTRLTTKITNNGTDKKDFEFKIKLIGNDGNVLDEITGYAGDLKAGQTKTIGTKITMDIVDIKETKYEIVK